MTGPLPGRAATGAVVVLAGGFAVVELYALVMTVATAVHLLSDDGLPLLAAVDLRGTDAVLAALWITMIGHATAGAVWWRGTAELVERRGGPPRLGRHWTLYAWLGCLATGLALWLFLRDEDLVLLLPDIRAYLLLEVLHVAAWTTGPVLLLAGVVTVHRRLRAVPAVRPHAGHPPAASGDATGPWI